MNSSYSSRWSLATMGGSLYWKLMLLHGNCNWGCQFWFSASLLHTEGICPGGIILDGSVNHPYSFTLLFFSMSLPFLHPCVSVSFTTSQCPLFTHCLPCTCSLMSCGDLHVCLWVSMELDLSLPIDSSVLVLTWRTYMNLNWSLAPSDSYTDCTYLHDHNFRPVVLMRKPSHQCCVCY